MQVADFRDWPVGALVPITVNDSPQHKGGNYHAFVPRPLPEAVDLSPSTYKILSEADRSLGALDARVNQLPNPRLLVRPALTREAVSTSALEGTYAPYAEVLEAEYVEGKESSAEVREVRNYVRAANRGLELIQELPICARVVAELQGVLVRGTRGDAYDAGRLRERYVCFGDRGRGIGESRFVPPPHGDALVEGVSDWEKWINSDQEMPTLVKVALSHYQFETLHPFSDGNGRIGRLVITMQLMQEGILEYPVLNLSPWLEPRRDDYIDHLLEVSKTGNFDPWVRFFGEAVYARARAATNTVERLMKFADSAFSEMRRRGARGAVLDLAANLIGYPVMTASEIQQALDVSAPTAYKAIARLEDAGYLKEITGGTWGRVYRCSRVYDILAES